MRISVNTIVFASDPTCSHTYIRTDNHFENSFIHSYIHTFVLTIGATVIAVWTIHEEDGETVLDHAYAIIHTYIHT